MFIFITNIALFIIFMVIIIFKTFLNTVNNEIPKKFKYLILTVIII